MIEWTTAASLAARAGIQAYNNRHTIQKWWTKACAYLDYGRTQVVVTGHAGAGKTLLASQMHGRARDLYFTLPAESRKVEVDGITLGSWTKLVRVLPGQTGHRVGGQIEAFDGNDQLEGVIHVVDFGYVHPRDAVQAAALIEKDGLDTLPKLRDRNLRLEVEDLKVLCSDIRRLLKSAKRPKWLLVAVNKVDLFPDAREDALKHYHPDGPGEFGRVLKDFQTEIGSSNLGIYVAQSCAYQQSFSWNGTSVSTGLAVNEQDGILREFMETVATISETH